MEAINHSSAIQNIRANPKASVSGALLIVAGAFTLVGAAFAPRVGKINAKVWTAVKASGGTAGVLGILAGGYLLGKAASPTSASPTSASPTSASVTSATQPQPPDAIPTSQLRRVTSLDQLLQAVGIGGRAEEFNVIDLSRQPTNNKGYVCQLAFPENGRLDSILGRDGSGRLVLGLAEMSYDDLNVIVTIFCQREAREDSDWIAIESYSVECCQAIYLSGGQLRIGLGTLYHYHPFDEIRIPGTGSSVESDGNEPPPSG